MKINKLIRVILFFISTIAFAEPVNYIFDDGIYRKEITVSEAPKKAVTLAQFMTEMLIALDLGDKIIGTVPPDGSLYPEFQEEYEKIPVLEIGDGHSVLSKEAFVAIESDFVSGWERAVSEEGIGSVDELVERGVSPFISSGLAPDATIESVYNDFTLLGKIFDVPQNAEKVVERMKKQIGAVTEKTDKIAPQDRVRVLIYDSGEGEAFVGGSGLPADLVRLAGGDNICKDLGQDYGTVSFESIIERNPQVIVVTEYYTGISGDEKIKFLKNHPGLRETDAVKNNRIYKIGLIELAPGMRNADAVEKMYNMFYGEK